MMTTFDDLDQQILEERVKERTARRAEYALPMVGDAVRDITGKMRRITHVWEGEGCQTGLGGMFYLNQSGGCEYGGGLYGIEPAENFRRTEESQLLSVWFFHHDLSGRDRGVTGYILFPVWELSTKFKEY